jgi:hypothetical protein
MNGVCSRSRPVIRLRIGSTIRAKKPCAYLSREEADSVPGRWPGLGTSLNPPGSHEPLLAGEAAAPVYAALARADELPLVLAEPMRHARAPVGARAGAGTLGNVASVRAVLSWGRSRTNVSAIESLQLPQAVLTARQAATLARQLRRVWELCGRVPAGGVGLSVPGAPGLARAFACPDGPVLLMAAPSARLWVRSGGVLLEDLDGPGRRIDVAGWRVGAAHLVVSTRAGDLDLTGSAVGRLLTSLVPAADEIVVHDVPLRAVFADLLSPAVEIARDAAASGQTMVVWHQTERGSR